MHIFVYIYIDPYVVIYILQRQRDRERDLRRKHWMVPPAASFVSEGEQGFLIFIWPHAEGGDTFWSC